MSGERQTDRQESLTDYFDDETVLHRQRQREVCERVESDAGMSACFTAHHRLELPVEQVHYNRPVTHDVIVPALNTQPIITDTGEDNSNHLCMQMYAQPCCYLFRDDFISSTVTVVELCVWLVLHSKNHERSDK